MSTSVQLIRDHKVGEGRRREFEGWKDNGQRIMREGMREWWF